MTDSGNDNSDGAGKRQDGGSLIDIIADCGDGMWLDGADIVPATDALVCVATDGHKLAADRIAGALRLPGAAGEWPSIILPRKTAAALARALKGAKGELVVEASDTKVRFTFGAMVLTSKLIDGTYPDYARVAPSDNPIRARVGRGELAAALDRVSTVASERGRGVKLSFAAETLTLEARNADVGAASEEVRAELDGSEVEIGFNAAYLAAILAATDGDSAVFELRDPGSPARITDPAHEEWFAVLMPMRV